MNDTHLHALQSLSYVPDQGKGVIKVLVPAQGTFRVCFTRRVSSESKEENTENTSQPIGSLMVIPLVVSSAGEGGTLAERILREGQVGPLPLWWQTFLVEGGFSQATFEGLFLFLLLDTEA